MTITCNKCKFWRGKTPYCKYETCNKAGLPCSRPGRAKACQDFIGRYFIGAGAALKNLLMKREVCSK